MKQLSKHLWLAILASFCCIPLSLQATHFVGADITYSCLTPCTYRVFHTTFYDCAGAATPTPPASPPTPFINFIGSPSNCTTTPLAQGVWVLAHYLEITPVCPQVATSCTNPNSPIYGTLEALYYRDYNLCAGGATACTKYDITWGSCCRSAAITSGAANDGIFVKTTIDLTASPCNSSPKFVNYPAILVCSGSKTVVEQYAFDPDGDSLVYSLGPCQDNASAAVGYNTGYSPTAPLGPSWNVSIDPVNGDLTFDPNPGAAVQAVLCLKIEEYRNGVKVGEVWRDYPVSTINCNASSVLPQVDSIYLVTGGQRQGQWNIKACVGNAVNFQIAASDSNATDTLGMYANTSHIPGNVNLTYSGTNPLIGNFTWTPTQAGTYTFSLKVFDQRCPVPQQNFQRITVTVDSVCLDGVVVHTQCNLSNGSIDLTPNGMVAPITYLWSNGATTQDITGLSPGTYTVTATDANGTTATKSFMVDASNIILNASVNDPTCADRFAGSISISPSGGTAPYSYSWTTGASTDSIGGLSSGGYTVYVQDSDGCPKHAVFILQQPDSCFNIIEGLVYDDQNGNCTQDAGEMGIANVFVDITPGGGVFTDLNGAYKFRADSGNSTVTVYPHPYYSANCPVGGSHSFSFSGYHNSSSGNDFAMDFIQVQDLKVGYSRVRARPGFNQSHYLYVKNNGSIPMSGTLKWTHDPIFDYLSANPTHTTYNAATREAEWAFTNLLPGDFFRVGVLTHIDSTVGLGVWYTNTAEALPTAGDSTPSDNYKAWQDTTTNSFDPNDKAVEPKGIREPGYVKANDELMEYHIRFQNTGTDTAYYVMIRDTLDDDLDYRTLQPAGASHPYTLTVEDDKVLVFMFANIYLPDSGANYAASQGYASFTVKQLPGLAAGTEIRNNAAIYFDFNAPIITNEVLNTIYTQPAVSVGADTMFCGDGGDLTADIVDAGMPPYDFTWSHGPTDPGNTSGQSTSSVTTTGSYTVSVIDAFGFVTNDTVQVTTVPLPDAAFQATIANLTVGFSNTATGNASWMWDFGDGNSSSGQATVAHNYAMPGLYTATLIVQNDCGSDTVTQIVDLRVNSLDLDLFARSVHFSPNPMTKSATLSFSNPTSSSFTLKIYDTQGRLVQQAMKTQGEKFEVNRGQLTSGIYLYELRSEDKQFVGRMVLR